MKKDDSSLAQALEYVRRVSLPSRWDLEEKLEEARQGLALDLAAEVECSARNSGGVSGEAALIIRHHPERNPQPESGGPIWGSKVHIKLPIASIPSLLSRGPSLPHELRLRDPPKQEASFVMEPLGFLVALIVSGGATLLVNQHLSQRQSPLNPAGLMALSAFLLLITWVCHSRFSASAHDAHLGHGRLLYTPFVVLEAIVLWPVCLTTLLVTVITCLHWVGYQHRRMTAGLLELEEKSAQPDL